VTDSSIRIMLLALGYVVYMALGDFTSYRERVLEMFVYLVYSTLCMFGFRQEVELVREPSRSSPYRKTWVMVRLIPLVSVGFIIAWTLALIVFHALSPQIAQDLTTTFLPGFLLLLALFIKVDEILRVSYAEDASTQSQ
jgi:magnesium-transporting ATPase (P-type)